MLRREEMYIDPKTEEEKDILLNSGQDEGTMNAIFAKFYGMIIFMLKCSFMLKLFECIRSHIFFDIFIYR